MSIRVFARWPTLEAAFDPRANSLNGIRLLLAMSVIIWHSFPVTGSQLESDAVRQVLSEGGVDGFFAASGFLILSSWLRKPQWWAFLSARVLRIFPAFLVCLVITAGVIAPAALIACRQIPNGFAPSAVSYVVSNATLKIRQWDIAGTPIGVPYEGVWNGSLWTLWWEFLCYLSVLGLGMVHLLKARWTVPIVFVLALAALLLTDLGVINNYYLSNGSRFGVMFASGAMIFRYRQSIRASWPLVALAIALVLASSWLPDYRIVAAIPLAYAVITSGALVRRRAFRFKNDISYGVYIYAFPLQQSLALFGLTFLSPVAFAALSIVLTVPLAVTSWLVIERPALRLRPVVSRYSSQASGRLRRIRRRLRRAQAQADSEHESR